MASTSAAGAAGGEGGARAPLIDPIVQYVVLRKDLWTEKGWPLGSVVAQACHASSAAIWTHRDDAATLEYCCPERIDQMHKVRLYSPGVHFVCLRVASSLCA